MTPMQEKNNSTTTIEETGELSRPRSRRKKKKEKPSGTRTAHPLVKGISIILVLVVSLLAGLFVGFSVVGKGSGLEAFDWNTYQHIYNLVFKTDS